MTKEELVTFSRLIYQNDSCMIFHCANNEHKQAVYNVMESEQHYQYWLRSGNWILNDGSWIQVYTLIPQNIT